MIDQDEQQVGVLEIAEARQLALDAGLDLVEVAPTARPPVCRVMDYGKWKYEQKKKDRQAKVNRHEVVLKEVRMRPKTDPHDQLIKINHAKSFLLKGNKVQFTLRFRGREMVHLDLGRKAFNRIKEELADIAKVERDFKMEGRRLTMVLSPLTKTEIKGESKDSSKSKAAPQAKPAPVAPQAKPAPVAPQDKPAPVAPQDKPAPVAPPAPAPAPEAAE